MDGRRLSDSLRRFFIAKGLSPDAGLRGSMLEAGVFRARGLIEGTLAAFESVAGFDNNGVDCHVARVEWASDGGTST